MRAKNFFLFSLLFFCLSCKHETNKLDVTVSRVDSANIELTRIYDMEIRNADSIFYYKSYRYFYKGDTLQIGSLPSGEYEISYLEILGKRKTRNFNFKNLDAQIINIVFDSIDTRMFRKKAPIYNIKNGETYRVERRGGGGMGYYTLTKENDILYFEAPYRKPNQLMAEQINAINKFEAELLAIKNVDVCSSTGRMHYKIISQEDTINITDNACNWYGWETLMRQIPIDEDIQ